MCAKYEIVNIIYVRRFCQTGDRIAQIEMRLLLHSFHCSLFLNLLTHFFTAFSVIPHVLNSYYSDRSTALVFLSVPVWSCSVAGGMFTVHGVFRNSDGRACANVFTWIWLNGFVPSSTSLFIWISSISPLFVY